MSDRLLGRVPEVRQRRYEDFDLTVSHDEAYLYLLLQKRKGQWDFSDKELDVGFGTLAGGSSEAEKAPRVAFRGGIQFLLQIKGERDSHLWINSAYDPHTWLYGAQLDYMPDAVIEKDPRVGVFLPWRLALNRPLELPQSGRKIPFEDYEVGRMNFGITDPSDPEFDSLADWYAEGEVLEARIPWTMLGYTDPSTLRVWDYPYKAGKIETVRNADLRVYPALQPAGNERVSVEPLTYAWKGWDRPTYHERKKKSYKILSEVFEGYDQVKTPP